MKERGLGMLERIILRLREVKYVFVDMFFMLGIMLLAVLVVAGFWYVMLRIS